MAPRAVCPFLQTAFALQASALQRQYCAGWTDPAMAEKCIDWTRELASALEAFGASDAYVNYLGEEGSSGCARPPMALTTDDSPVSRRSTILIISSVSTRTYLRRIKCAPDATIRWMQGNCDSEDRSGRAGTLR